jgi:hypothetical protein
MDIMKLLKTYFPLSFDTKDIVTLLIKIAVYLVAGVIVGLVCAVIGFIPIIGGIIGWLVGTVVGLYVLGGIVLAVLDFLKILK